MLLSFLREGGSFNLIVFLTELIVSLPAFLLALSLHEAAHAYVALRAGDPTAKMMGRVTVNPLKHLDPVGFGMLLIAGVGWAKPVPVNPRNFKNPRRDDFLVSIAGITMNLCLSLIGAAFLYGLIAAAIRAVPRADYLSADSFKVLIDGAYYRLDRSECFLYAAGMQKILIAPYLGDWVSYLYEFFMDFAVVNLSLSLFNLLPVPPLDGYHVLNDLVMKRSLFADPRAMRAGQGVILLLAVTGLLSRGLNFLLNGAFSWLGRAFYALFGALGML